MINNSDYIGKRIREKRLLVGITQATLAEASALSPQYICQIETGKRQASLTSLLSISKALGISLDDLLCGVQNTPTDYTADIAELLSDCSPYERRVIFETIASLKSALKSNMGLFHVTEDE